MKARPLLLVAIVGVMCSRAASTLSAQMAADTAQRGGAIKTSTDPVVGPNAAIISDFKARLDKYAALHTGLATGAAAQQHGRTAKQIEAQTAALAAKLHAARATAKHGDVFTPEIRIVFRQLLAPNMKGKDGRDARAQIKDDAPASGSVSFKVNAMYPEGQPKPTMPGKLLRSLPPLPASLEYRVVGQHLLLLDTACDLVVDYILNVIVT